jgi:hypothetical protein
MFNLRGPTREEPEDHLWSADHSLRKAVLKKCTFQEEKFPVKISSGSVERRYLIPVLMG